jgi:hypothetical protein
VRAVSTALRFRASVKIMNPRLPGLPTMVGLMLVALGATWLSLAGPPNLKEWQPLLAACIALIGGAMAYKGAMAKVDFDREVHNREVRRRTIGLLLKLDFASRLFSGEANRARTWMDVGAREGQRSLTVEDFSIPRPREFDEAWDNLDIFPSSVVFDLANIKSSLRTLEAVVLNFKPD